MIPPVHLSQTMRPRRGSLCRTIGTIRPPREPGVDCVWNRLRVSLQGVKVRSARGEWTCPLPGGPNRAGIAPQYHLVCSSRENRCIEQSRPRMLGAMLSRLLIGSRQPQYATIDWRWIQPPATCPKSSACPNRPDVRFSGCRPRPWASAPQSQRAASGERQGTGPTFFSASRTISPGFMPGQWGTRLSGHLPSTASPPMVWCSGTRTVTRRRAARHAVPS